MMTRAIMVMALAAGVCLAGVDRLNPDLRIRQQVWLDVVAERELPQGPNPGTWVDAERWCVAHACLATGVRLEEANQYLAAVEPVSMWRGLVADTDVQVTDLLRTYLEFRDGDRLSPAARARLEAFFRDWRVPNADRNCDADTRYEWPGAYTENHALNNLVAAYLIDVALGRDRLLRLDLLERFLADRARWGWSEFHSPSYFLVTAKALSCLSDFAPDGGLATAAALNLDMLTIQYAVQCLGTWRGVPFVRGYGSQVDNQQNSAVPLAELWWGGPSFDIPQAVNPMAVHLLTSRYGPPAPALSLARDPGRRGVYTLRMTGTTGPGRLQVPMVMHVRPSATMASAQGSGSYYDGCYWTISFATSPRDVITGHYGGGRTILQVDNVMAVFGTAQWRGGLKPETDGNRKIASAGPAWVGQVDLDADCHVFLLSDGSGHPDLPSFRAALDALQAAFTNAVVSWVMPDGRPVRLTVRRDGERRQFVQATVAGADWPLLSGMLIDSPWVRSVRESAVLEVIHANTVWTYDLRDPKEPRTDIRHGGRFAPLPPATLDGPLGIRLRLIPGGAFPMGSGVTEGHADEHPVRWVPVDACYLSEFEITVGQYRQYLEAVPEAARLPDWYWSEWGKTDRHAMTWISGDEAAAFCGWLSKQDGRAYRLPTEEEWEKGARGFTYRVYPWGDTYDGSQAGTPNGTYDPVGSKPADRSPFGLLDMAGGVWEWCTAGEAPVAAGRRILRGCGWNFDPDTFRCAYRSAWEGTNRSVHLGFRIACNVP